MVDKTRNLNVSLWALENWDLSLQYIVLSNQESKTQMSLHLNCKLSPTFLREIKQHVSKSSLIT